MDLTGSKIPPIRSTKGCWTCRLRKKKCPEERPECSRCKSVDISCQYGQRPDWITNSNLGKEELGRIKIRVAASAKRKRAAFRARTRASVETASNLNDGEDGSSPSTSNRFENEGIPNSSRILGGATDDSSLFEDKETGLMMHYLDHVFYIQFRFYTPSVAGGGRGWLLSLLRHTKPLYHAALSLSAFHQQSLLSVGQSGVQTQKNYLQELERHHNLTLKELQSFILAQGAHDGINSKCGDIDSNVQILACMVQLISFELFNGGESNWKMHLTAASALISSHHKQELQASSSEGNSLQVDTTKPNSSSHAALNFFTAVIIWFDVLSCISSNSRPHLLIHHETFFPLAQKMQGLRGAFLAKYDLSSVMGCQNWVIVTIGQIAELGSRQGDPDAATTPDIHETARQAIDIQIHLESGNSHVRDELDEMRQLYPGNPPYYLTDVYRNYTTLVVTYVFGTAALIYLQTSITSSPSIFHIQGSLQDVVSAMRMIPDPRMIRGMVWPLCVAGCLASSPGDQEFFRSMATTAIDDAGTFGNSCKALEILEMAWKLQREEGRLTDCTTCIRRLGTCVLLV